MKTIRNAISALITPMMATGGQSKQGQNRTSGGTLPVAGRDSLKVKSRTSAVPTYLTTRNPDTSQTLRITDYNTATLDISRLQRSQGTRGIMRAFVNQAPVVSSSVAAHLRVAITNGYKVTGHSMDGTFDRDMTKAAMEVIARLDKSPSFDIGSTVNYGLRALSESLIKDMLTYGAMSGELVLDELLMPSHVLPVSVTTIEFKPRRQGRGLSPVQIIEGDEVSLDIPTFFYMSLDQDLLDAYARSPFESAIKPTFFSETLMADIIRVSRRAAHPRQVIKLIEDKIRQNAPDNVINSQDPMAMTEFVDSMVLAIADNINNLEPDEVLVLRDSVEANYLNNGNSSISREWEALIDITNSNLSSGLKTAPTILGHHTGSSNIASTESQLFIKQVQGAVQYKLNDFYSQMLTLAIRLMGHDGYVEFRYDGVELRSELELESFMTIKQSRKLEELSLGLITEDEYFLSMYGTICPDHLVGTLSGTQFRAKNPSDMNPYLDESNSGSTLNQKRDADTPNGVKGQNNKRNPQKED